MTWATVLIAVLAALAGVLVGFILGRSGHSSQAREPGTTSGWLRRCLLALRIGRRRTETPVNSNPSAKDRDAAAQPRGEVHIAQEPPRQEIGLDRDRVEYLRSQGDATRLPPEWRREQTTKAVIPTTASQGRVELTQPDGSRLGIRLQPDHRWRVTDFPGLAVDMRISVLGGIRMVSVRTPSTTAYIDVDGGRLPLTQVEIPWRGGALVNGECSITSSDRFDTELMVKNRPVDARFSVAVLGDWFCVTDDQPRLARIAAHLFIPENLHAVSSWQDRLRAYTQSLSFDLKGEPTLVHVRAGNLYAAGGTVVRLLGLGTTSDDVPAKQFTVPLGAGPEVINSELDRMWVPTDERNPWDPDTCYVVDRLRRR